MSKLYFLLTFVLWSNLSHSQSDTLQARYDQVLDNSETYLKYKVIIKDNLDLLWLEVQDSIQQYQVRLTEQANLVETLNNELEATQQLLSKSENEVNQWQAKSGTINFLGMALSVGTYHSLVWALIVILAASVMVIYGMSIRARSLTKSTASDLKNLQVEYDQFKERARTKEAKVKRELQTALNRMEEMKRGSIK
jgi:hypothetical protein